MDTYNPPKTNCSVGSVPWIISEIITLIVFIMSGDRLCSLALPNGAVDGLQCVVVVFPDHTPLLCFAVYAFNIFTAPKEATAFKFSRFNET